ncbi:MAG: hypothetical protein PVJ19_10395 [Desulfobacteraceae bacterium]
MKMRLLCTGGEVSLNAGSFASWADVMGSVGMKFGSGVLLEFETQLFRRLFVISDPVSLIKGVGIKATLIGMDYFEVSNPPKSVVIADLNHHLADVEIEGRNMNRADVKITVCDKLNQPYYIIEKYNVSYEGFMTSDYSARGDLNATKTFHKVPDRRIMVP